MEFPANIFKSTCGKIESVPDKHVGESNISSKTVPLFSPQEIEEYDQNTPLNQVNERLKKLRIECDLHERTDSQEKSKHTAGRIIQIITALNTVIVQPHTADDLLYFGTPLFLTSEDSEDCGTRNYILLGYINDIFGSIGEPMYSVEIVKKAMNVSQIGEAVYYSPNEANTSHMYVEHTAGGKLSKSKYMIRTR